MPAITNIYKSIKTNKALEYLQDMVITGNQMILLGFAVASQNGALDPERTIDDIYPTWYPTSGQYTAFSIAPANVSTTLSFVMDIPAAVTNNEVYITEIYIYAEYKGETFYSVYVKHK
jgi:hypothetical protein